MTIIAKPFNPVVARKRVDNIVVKHVLERERLQAALRETELLAARRAQELLHVAEHDRLTGLYNRTAFCRKTAELLAAHPDEEFAVIQFDIERFKIINELYGSAKGDEVLLAIARTLGEWLHVAGVYGRMEGDRFALCLPHDVALEGDYVRALEEAVAATEVDRQVVLYFGVYEIEDRTMPVDIMCDRANLALHSVKGDYNTHFALYDSDMHQTFLANHELVGEGERALREGRFEPFVQPVFDLATACAGERRGARALARPAEGARSAWAVPSLLREQRLHHPPGRPYPRGGVPAARADVRAALLVPAGIGERVEARVLRPAVLPEPHRPGEPLQRAPIASAPGDHRERLRRQPAPAFGGHGAAAEPRLHGAHGRFRRRVLVA